MPTNAKPTSDAPSKNQEKDLHNAENLEANENSSSTTFVENPSNLPNGFMSPFRCKSDSIFQFPTVVDGQMTFSGIPVHPIAAALGQPIPADQVSSVASQLTSHMSNAASPMALLTPKLVATITSTNTSIS